MTRPKGQNKTENGVRSVTDNSYVHAFSGHIYILSSAMLMCRKRPGGCLSLMEHYGKHHQGKKEYYLFLW